MKSDFNTYPNEAPMTEPTEAEIEAAKSAVADIPVGDHYWINPHEADEIARAALTAAAQVRERAGEPDGWTLVPTALTPEMRVAATGWHGLDELWRKTLAAAPVPSLMPIYSATEDQG